MSQITPNPIFDHAPFYIGKYMKIGFFGVMHPPPPNRPSPTPPPPSPPVTDSLPPPPPSPTNTSSAPPPPQHDVSLSPSRKRKRTSAEEVHHNYGTVLNHVKSGRKKFDAVKSAPMPASSFYKWVPIAEMKIVDPLVYNNLQTSNHTLMELLHACKERLKESDTTLAATRMRSSGDLLK